MKKKYIKYAEDVVSGRIIAGDLIIKACQRFLNDLKRKDLVFKEDKADYAIRFISILKHFTGKSAGQNFILEPWQEFIVANLTGFYWKTGERRFTSAYIECCRKQGKTALCGALAMYYLIADGEPGAEIDLAANSKEQAKIAFSFCQQFARQCDPQAKTLKSFRDTITLDENASKIKVFSSDDSKLDGFNASVGLIDEYHSAKNSRVRDVIKSSMGMRTDPMLLTITTAGFDKNSPCYQLRTTCSEILNGFKTDDSVFIAIYSLNEDDNWQDESVWEKCAPNLNVTVTKKYIREQVQSAINNPGEEVGVRTKTLNQWCDSSEVWIPDLNVNKCRGSFDWEKFRGEYVYLGVDLASVSDLTALSWCFYSSKEQKYYFYTDYFLPADSIKGPNADLFKQWVADGSLLLTPGNVTDYNYITSLILEREKQYGLKIWQINYDPYNSVQWAIDATGKGLNLNPYSQTVFNFNKPTKELERIILAGACVIDSNQITAYCFRNVKLRYDSNQNCKPDKKDSQIKKIDGVISMIEALACCLDNTGGYVRSHQID